MKADYYIHEKQYIEAKNKGWQGWGGDERLKKIPEYLERLFSYPELPENCAVLELGCGEGHISRHIHEKGYDVTGVDISETAVNWAREKATALNLDIDYYQSDLSETDALDLLNNRKFKLIYDGVCFHCIIGDDRKIFLNNIYNALEEKGVVFISSLCSKGLDNEIIYNSEKPYRHITTEKNLIDELEQANFTILKSQVFENEKYNHVCVHAIKK